MRLLIIEDDTLIGDGLKTGLEKLGFSVDWFDDGLTGLEALFQAPYDAVILDLTLPGMDGLEILKTWRAKGRTDAVLILTARGDVDQRVMGLNTGADDYLAKPFSLKEVQARLNALIRRTHSQGDSDLHHNSLHLDLHTKTVSLRGKIIDLSPKEKQVLELLLLNKNKVLSKETLENKLYSWNEEIASNAVEVHIHHLRKKLGKDFIKTIPKIGYMLEECKTVKTK